MLGAPPPGGKLPSAGDFTKYYGPWIVIATIVLPAVVAAWLNGRGHRAGQCIVRRRRAYRRPALSRR
jgi:PAT family beta-lactamase induction signal transducer AmpG